MPPALRHLGVGSLLQEDWTASRQPHVQTYCVACKSAVGAISSGGCKLACGILPMPASAICEWVQGFVSMCADIAAWLKQGLSPEEICKHLGYCGTECQCGVCSALSYPLIRLGIFSPTPL